VPADDPADSLLLVRSTPLICADLELSRPLVSEPSAGRGLSLLVRLHGDPLGVWQIEPVDVEPGDSKRLITRAQHEFAEQIAAHVASGCRWPDADDGESCPASGELQTFIAPVSVIIPTVGTRATLANCLTALCAQEGAGEIEIIVVCNRAQSMQAVERIVAAQGDTRIVVLREDRPGVSYARNTGIAAAQHNLVLFTDDDVTVDSRWVARTVAVFEQDAQIGAVTGLVLPGSLETQAERDFELSSSFAKGFLRRVWALQQDDHTRKIGPSGDGGPLFPFSAGYMGSGNSMAFRSGLLATLGGFDPALRTGQDLDLFCRLIMAGEIIVYEPRVLVRHFHRDSPDALIKQTRRYGMGLSALLTKQFLHTPGARSRLLRVVPTGTLRYLGSRHRSGVVPGEEGSLARAPRRPPKLAAVELGGFVVGPFHYLWARHKIKSA